MNFEFVLFRIFYQNYFAQILQTYHLLVIWE